MQIFVIDVAFCDYFAIKLGRFTYVFLLQYRFKMLPIIRNTKYDLILCEFFLIIYGKTIHDFKSWKSPILIHEVYTDTDTARGQ